MDEDTTRHRIRELTRDRARLTEDGDGIRPDEVEQVRAIDDELESLGVRRVEAPGT